MADGGGDSPARRPADKGMGRGAASILDNWRAATTSGMAQAQSPILQRDRRARGTSRATTVHRCRATAPRSATSCGTRASRQAMPCPTWPTCCGSACATWRRSRTAGSNDLPGSVYAVWLHPRLCGISSDSTPTRMVRRFKDEVAGIDRQTELHFPEPVAEGRVPGGAILLIAVVLAAVAYGGWFYLSSENRSFDDMVPRLPDRFNRPAVGRAGDRAANRAAGGAGGGQRPPVRRGAAAGCRQRVPRRQTMHRRPPVRRAIPASTGPARPRPPTWPGWRRSTSPHRRSCRRPPPRPRRRRRAPGRLRPRPGSQPDDTAPEDIAPEDIAPEDTAPEDTAPEAATPGSVAADATVSDPEADATAPAGAVVSADGTDPAASTPRPKANRCRPARRGPPEPRVPHPRAPQPVPGRRHRRQPDAARNRRRRGAPAQCQRGTGFGRSGRPRRAAGRRRTSWVQVRDGAGNLVMTRVLRPGRCLRSARPAGADHWSPAMPAGWTSWSTARSVPSARRPGRGPCADVSLDARALTDGTTR